MLEWVSTEKVKLEILKQLLPNASEATILNLDKDLTIKTLSLQWNSEFDCTQYVIPEARDEKPVTKCTVLSKVSQNFDPLALLGPISTKAKILRQTLWQWWLA